MPFAVEQDRWGYYVIVDTRSHTRAVYTRNRVRAEWIVQQLNEELGGFPAATVHLPDAVERRQEPQPVGWSTRARS